MNSAMRSVLEMVGRVASYELLLNFTLKAALILSLALIINIFLKRSSSAIRHWVWSLAFYSILILPVLSLTLPQKPLNLPDPLADSFITAKAYTNRTAATGSRSALTIPQRAEAETTAYIRDEEKKGYAISSLSQPLDSIDWPMIALAIWLFVSIFFLLRTGIEITSLLLISRSGRRVVDREWNELLPLCKKRLKVSRSVNLRASRIVTVPVTFGHFRPVVLLPPDAHKWSVDQKEAVLLHELAHIKRLDFLSNLVAQIVCAVCWHIPLTWMARRKLQIERERACDDRVINQGMSRCDYAGHLLEIARSLPQRRLIGHAAVGAAQRSELKERIQSILNHKVRRHTLTRASALVSLIAVLLFAMPVATMQLKSDDGSTGKASFSSATVSIDSDSISEPELKPEADSRAIRSFEESIVTLKSYNPELRARAALALGEAGNPRAVKPLIAALSEENLYVKEAVIQALGHIADKRAFYSVAELLKYPDPGIRRTAVWALGEIGCDPAFVSVATALKDQSPSVREMAVEVMGRFRKEDADKSFLKLLDDYNPSARSYVAKAIGRFDDSTINEVLTAALSDESPKVRQGAARSLAKLDGHQATDLGAEILQGSQTRSTFARTSFGTPSH